MKMHIEIECTPEEARQFMGLPDVQKANEAYVEAFSKTMQGASSTDQLDEFAKQLSPMGDMGMKLFQNFMASAMKQANPMSPDTAAKRKK